MTAAQLEALGPALAAFLEGFGAHFRSAPTFEHLRTYTRGLLSDLPRKTAEPIALAAGTPARTLQEFLKDHLWDHTALGDDLQTRVAQRLPLQPADETGTVGLIDETSALKKGAKTPGVGRQYLGCVGKVDNGIVTVHLGVSRGSYRALLDADLYLPKEWDADRERCRDAGIPDTVRYRPKWRIALDQLARLERAGVRPDWLVFDEGYGSKVPMLRILNLAGRKFVAEVPVNFSVRDEAGGRSRRADERLTPASARGGSRHRIAHRTVRASYWRAASVSVWAAGREHSLVVAVSEATGEVKYFLTNATGETLERVLAVAFRRWTVEHSFRLGKQEAGLMDYEGRDYTGLLRHLILALVVLGFVATHTERLRGGKPGGDGRAGVPGVEPTVRGRVPASAGRPRGEARQHRHPLPPATQRGGR